MAGRKQLSEATRDELESRAEIAWSRDYPKTQNQIETDEQRGYASLLFTADEMHDVWVQAYVTAAIDESNPTPTRPRKAKR